MAYSDYGGYAFRNGERVVERSDFTITPEGGYGTPGSWAGFALMAAGMPHAEVMKEVERPQYHAVLGDGPLLVGLYKQSTAQPYRLPAVEQVEWVTPEAFPNRTKSWTDKEGKVSTYVDCPYGFVDDDVPAVVEIDGHKLEVFWRDTDNYYVFARLTQPDGTVWHGFSGYGVGEGLEDCGYGYSTSRVEDLMWELFPRPPVTERSGVLGEGAPIATPDVATAPGGHHES